MVSSIKELENEIESFRENIFASQKIVASFDKLPKVANKVLAEIQSEAEECNKQATAMIAALEEKETELLEKIGKLTEQVGKDNEYYLKNIDSAIKNLQEENNRGVAEITSKNKDFLQEISMGLGKALGDTNDNVNDLKKAVAQNYKALQKSLNDNFVQIESEICRIPDIVNDRINDLRKDIKFIVVMCALVIGLLIGLNGYIFFKMVK